MSLIFIANLKINKKLLFIAFGVYCEMFLSKERLLRSK